ncbi:hypothetical protein GbCGDNIH1_7145 [Granulibacter bethesdensis CGDNIH1]|uniref:Uncharacterized protein n=1 Tax=Granulibacter bethesdensis (strain ATCC BAA-1260 / CGDNIH1) TaxID=391165 RepID=A0A286M306_GRABC|nr:hypothetical protein GbCGDNIH4_7145 [Granulibacter bethesdensis CGDNIH4]APH51846.1 hypothetical protein GbCGDNIH5_7145 [Granulibacter bethesdensis]APH59478.1 hypothetical protein GbCGDNIH7_7145 [Granulibacter bethesdensis]APH64537.1 hypothetical protein GbCGDNIH1I4_7145 [Granulibacter bethesdensis]ASV62405.1 hypothetical protein GbCGDNIH1_7145 [Granulibacter bethesdensis CGDNIH1]
MGQPEKALQSLKATWWLARSEIRNCHKAARCIVNAQQVINQVCFL